MIPLPPQFQLSSGHRRTVIRGSDILTRTEDGYISTPNLFFDPERWSQAYEHQKQCGFVFTPREFVRLVALASKIIFYEKYRLVVDGSADRASKTADEIKPDWFELVVKEGLCDQSCSDAYTKDYNRLIPIREDDLRNVIPTQLIYEDPSMIKRLCNGLSESLLIGLTPCLHKIVLDGINHLLQFIIVISNSGDFVGIDKLSESELQTKLVSHLRSREFEVSEGEKLGGGATDLVLSKRVVIENKVLKETLSPLTDGENFSWQVRRYSIPLSTSIAFEMVAYKPVDEVGITPLSQCICVKSILEGKSKFVVIRIVVPYGYCVPSHAKKPNR
jgi:hypothetical protein